VRSITYAVRVCIHGMILIVRMVLLRFANMGFGSFAQVLRSRGAVPVSLLPSVARMLVHALKQLHGLRYVCRRLGAVERISSVTLGAGS
jgi:hypothetical protein